ncbi:MAG: hypothetical protein PVJ63_11190 [Thioalkalispiraceae bacterium]|jgi:hypothetical protein
MKRLLVLLYFLALPVYAQYYQFAGAIEVTLSKPGTFHHLDGSGRKNIAVSDKQVAVVWEDNRTGTPQVYTAFKALDATQFDDSLRLSQPQHEAYEPTLLAVDNDTFLYAWEANQHAWLTTVSHNKPGPVQQLDKQHSTQVSLTRTREGKIYAAWIQHTKQQQQVMLSEISFKDSQLRIAKPVLVDTLSRQRHQSYPSLVAVDNGLVIGWEDRQHGHTRIYTSYSADGKQFAPKQLLNDFTPPPNPEYGRGTGATRVALASGTRQRVVATWMDKRNFLGGYDIYAALSNNAGKSFGADEKAQDMLGENLPQWHPAIAIDSRNRVFVAWDDPRDGSPDIWYSLRDAQGWSDDEILGPASGAKAQTNPSLCFDQHDRLHVVWLHQTDNGTELRYSHSQ